MEDFEKELRNLNLDIEGSQMESMEKLKLLRKELLLLMIDKELLIQEAKSRGIKTEPIDLEIYVNDLARGLSA